jgi:hypothetical protein
MSKVVKSIGRAVGGVVKGVVKAVTSVVKAVVNVVASVINFVAQPFMGLLGGFGDMPNAASEAERQQGVLGQRQGSVVNVPVVYGYRKVGGVVTFAETGSTNNQYLWVAYVFSEGAVEGLREVYLDDFLLPTEITANLNAGTTVNITTGKYANRVQLQWFPGVYFDNPATSTVGTSSICKDAPGWKTTMTYNGLAVLFARYEWKEIKTQEDADNNPFSGNIPVVQVAMLGKKVASLVISNPETYTYANAPVRYSTNPAEILLDYLRNPRYGKGLFNDDIDWLTWRWAAYKCNQVVTYVNGITGNILTCNHVLDTSTSILANVKTLLMGMRAYMPYVQGKYKLKIEDAGNDTDILSGVATIVNTFTRDEIQGNITYTGIERSSKYNQVVVTYVDPDNKFSTQQVIYPETESERQTYVVLDGGRENKLEATFPTITNYAIAKDMARLLFNKSRFQESCTLTVSSEAMELEPGDNIRIQSTMLNFGTTPWRIVQTTLNDNMTYTLSCVRNPDSIYPHARVGEEDYVIPPHIPRGSTIYYPGVAEGQPIGLVPPVTAPWPQPSAPTYPGTPTNPPPTTPGDPVTVPGNTFTVTISSPAAFNTPVDHGFLGNGREELTLSTTGALPTGLNTTTKYYVMSAGLLPRSFRVSTTPGGTTPVNTSGSQSGTHTYSVSTYTGEITQPAPTPVPVPLPLDTVIDVIRAEYGVQNGAVNARITWLQPAHANYAGVDFWYKRNISTEPVYQTAQNIQRPGSGAAITHTFERLFQSGTPYVVIARVRYTTGESSTFKSTFYLNVSGAINVENPRDSFEIITPGWTLPTTPLANPRDTQFNSNSITGFTVFASPGVPADPRSVTFTGRQDIDIPSGINFEVDGVNIYYKLASATTWKKTTYQLPNPYTPGTVFTYTFPGDLGLRTYPSGDNASDNFDFIWRFKYKDGTESSRQFRYMNLDVERTDTSNFVISQSTGPFELVTAFPITLEDPAIVADSRLITITVTTVENAITSPSRIFFRFTPPAVTNQNSFWGVRVSYRPVTAGVATAFTVVDLLDEEVMSASSWRVNLPITYDQEYQFVLSPLVRYPSGTLSKVIANSSWIGQGKIHNRTTALDYPSNGNWFNALNFRTIESSTIPGIEATPFPTVDPYVAVRSWKLIQLDNGSTFHAGKNYFELEFDKSHITNYSRLHVYRRTSLFNKLGPALHTDVGRWEQVQVIQGTNATLLSNGNLLVNLRLPIDVVEYNPNFTGFPVTTNNQLIQSLYTTYKPVIPATVRSEYFLVVFSGSTPAESPKLVRLPYIQRLALASEVSSVNTPTVENRSAYNGYTAGYQRNLTVNADNGSRASVANANLKMNGVNGYTPPTPRRGGAIV